MELEQIITTDKQNVFRIRFDDNTVKTFFADMQATNDFDKNLKYNKNSLSSGSNGDSILSCALIHNMYDSTDPYYKSAIYKTSKSKRTGTSIDFQNITNHKLSAELSSVVKIDNCMYALEPRSIYGHSSLDIDTNTWLSAPYTSGKLNLRPIATMTYDRNYIVNCLRDNVPIDSEKCILEINYDVKYNMIYEFDGNIQNDYESSLLNANTIKGKNQYDCVYNMITSDNYNRDYVEICKCNNTLYLKYYDKNTNSLLNQFDMTLPNIEVVDSINRFIDFHAHKTNMFSIIITTDIFKKIKNTTFDKNNPNQNSIIKERITKNLKYQIINNVRTIVNKIIPTNTLLLNVYIEDYN